MNDSEKWDLLLSKALAPEAEPDEKLNQNIIYGLKERGRMKRVFRKRVSAGVLAVVFTLVMSFTAYAATQLFNSKQVVEHLGEKDLAQAFDSRDAIEINQTIDSAGYRFTLHGIVSGSGLKGFADTAQGFNPERTYAVVSIARQDGHPMPDTKDPKYGEEPFFVSPLIKGEKPWLVNIVTMHGGYSEFVLDGIMYRLIECDGVEMFADRGAYLAISSGSSFYSNDAFAFNEGTGKISPKAGYKGASIVFDLPLDKTKADHAKADAYLEKLLKEPSTKSVTAPAASNDESNLANEIEELKRKIPNGKVIPESIQKVSYDNKGNIIYDYDGWHIKILASELFKEGQTGYSDSVQFSGDGKTNKALQFFRDEKGVITGKITILD